jgi:hypothetical protein
MELEIMIPSDSTHYQIQLLMMTIDDDLHWVRALTVPMHLGDSAT